MYIRGRGCDTDVFAIISKHCVFAIVTMVSDANCTTGRPVPVTQSHGLLASVVTERTRLGSSDCPWLIDAVSGQTITVHLYDFGSVQRQNDSSLQLHPANTVSISIQQWRIQEGVGGV